MCCARTFKRKEKNNMFRFIATATITLLLAIGATAFAQDGGDFIANPDQSDRQTVMAHDNDLIMNPITLFFAQDAGGGDGGDLISPDNKPVPIRLAQDGGADVAPPPPPKPNHCLS